MPEICVSRVFLQDADTLWRVLGDFAGLDQWLPDVQHCEVIGNGAGAVRKVERADGGIVRERLVRRDDAARLLVYEIIEAPGYDPQSGFSGSLCVQPDLSGSRVVWKASYRVSDALPRDKVERGQRRVEAMYAEGLAALAHKLENPAGRF